MKNLRSMIICLAGANVTPAMELESQSAESVIQQPTLSKPRSQTQAPVVPSPGQILVTDIQIRGNDRTAPQIISLAIKTKAGDILEPDKVREDLREIYKLGFFQTPPSVQTEAHGSGVRLIYFVSENPQVDKIEISGNTLIPTEDILNAMTSKVGSVLNIRQLYEDLSAISALYREKGFLYSGIFNPAKQVQIVGSTVKLNVKESRINKIVLQGNKKTKDYVVMRELLMEEGQVVNRDRIADSLRNLRNLDYFELEQPDINLNPDTGDTDITLKLKDIKTGTASFGGGYSSINGMIGFVDATERNFRGKGQVVRVKTQFGGEQSYELGFTEPYFRNRNQAVGGSIFSTLVDREDIRNQALFSRFEEKRTGFSLFTTFRKKKDESHTFSFVDENISTKLLAGSPADLYNDHQMSLGYSWVLDQRDNFQNPSDGQRHNFTFTTTGGILAGNNNYNKYSYDFRKYWENNLLRKNTLAVRTKLGYAQSISGFIPYVDLWSVGGAQSVRGYEDREFAGEKMWFTNIELRYKLSKQFTTALFADFGSAWGSNNIDFDLKSSVGIGVRFDTPLGPFRLDWAKASDRSSGKIHFGIGNTF